MSAEDLLFDMCDTACVRAWDEEGWGPYHKRLLTMCVATEINGWKKRNGMTQNDKILNHIKKCGSISRREAFIEYSIQSFTARITELRQLGHKLIKVMKRNPVTGQAYARYYLNRQLANAKA
jgi:hypothetical protein